MRRHQPTDLATSVNLRIEGASDTVYEGVIRNGPRYITTPSGGTHLCDGTNDGANPAPFENGISAIDAASQLCGFAYDGTFSSQFDDFFITKIGTSDSTTTANEYWGILSKSFPPLPSSSPCRVIVSSISCSQSPPQFVGPKLMDATRQLCIHLSGWLRNRGRPHGQSSLGFQRLQREFLSRGVASFGKPRRGFDPGIHRHGPRWQWRQPGAHIRCHVQRNVDRRQWPSCVHSHAAGNVQTQGDQIGLDSQQRCDDHCEVGRGLVGESI